MMVRSLSGVIASLFLLSCGSPPPPASPSVASSVTAENPGANCVSGGTRFQFGVDDDSNGTLEAAEVDSTQYVCSTSNSFTNVYFRDLTLRSAADVEAAQAYTGILGSLFIEPTAIAPATTVDVVLPNLRFVHGSIMSDCGGSQARIWSFPELEVVTSQIFTGECDETLESVSAPKLMRSGGIDISAVPLLSSISLPSLRQIIGNAAFNVGDNQSLNNCEVLPIIHALRVNGWTGEWSTSENIECTSPTQVCRTTPVGTNSTDFRLCYDEVVWTAGKALCESIGAGWGLLYLRSNAERLSLQGGFQQIAFWAGYNDRAVDGTWVWDLSPTGNTYAPQINDGVFWRGEEPNGGGTENCSEMRIDQGSMAANDLSCGDSRMPACRYLAP
jgi:hypothetical protein